MATFYVCGGARSTFFAKKAGISVKADALLKTKISTIYDLNLVSSRPILMIYPYGYRMSFIIMIL